MGFLNPDPQVHAGLDSGRSLNPPNPSLIPSSPLPLQALLFLSLLPCCTILAPSCFHSSQVARALPFFADSSDLAAHLLCSLRYILVDSNASKKVATYMSKHEDISLFKEHEHSLPMPPHLLRPPLHDAIRGELEKLFLDKVIANLGLCISVYDILSVDGGFIFPGDGCATYKVQCRLVMFRPFIGEVIVGKIESCDEFGLQVSLGFFNDIKIPARLMMQPCHRGEDGIWVWDYGDGGEDSRFSLDIDEEIRFRVANVKFPPIPVEQSENSKPFSPMEITGDINGDGLGLVSWW